MGPQYTYNRCLANLRLTHRRQGPLAHILAKTAFSTLNALKLLGPVFGKIDDSQIFIFEPPHFCGFCHRISSRSCGTKKVPRKVLQENPRQNPP